MFKLRHKIIILIVGTSFLFISVFTYIQLRHQLEQWRSYNEYRARIGTIIVKTTLEMLLKDVQIEAALPGIFQAAITSFSKEGIVEKASIINMEGKPIATNDPIVKLFGETRKDIETYLKLSKKSGKEAWFYSTINNKTKTIDIFIPITIPPQTMYITKLSFSIAQNITNAMIDIFIPLSFMSIAIIMGNVFVGFILVNTVVKPIRVLNEATKVITSGNLDRSVNIKTHDEIEELGDTFNVMTKSLKRMKEIAENANPLTGLPGNNIIREEVEKRIKGKDKFVAIHADLDNFKAYNDRYGIGKGDEVIKFTSAILQKATQKDGNKDDFIGHEGGDDFFLITTPAKADNVVNTIIGEFDGKIRGFYTEEDQKKGYVLEKDRSGQSVRFPIMTISLAGITNQFRSISSYAELTNIAVSVKEKAKEIPKSNFCIDRRKKE